jgi:3-deoxy-manno-octulosonate cytidylyltransferase (CMP-KDO synthetase)
MSGRIEGPVWAVIPARWASTRFPGKVLAPLAGRPLLHWVVRAVRRARGIDRIVVATDDQRVCDALGPEGVEVVLTSAHHVSGSDRIGEVVSGSDAAVVINVQGDEPLLDPDALEELLAALADEPAAGASTLVTALEHERIADPNVVKVARAADGHALYFSRAAIPGVHPQGGRMLPVWRHIGLYGYRRWALDAFLASGPSPLEVQEGLEQLRLLELGVRIAVRQVAGHAQGVDVPADLQRCERILAHGDGAV